MARNVEKSQNVLNRLLNAKAAELRTGGGPPKPKRRPFLASECSDLADADRWRAQVVREIGSKVMEIQNAGLGEAKLRDLNDEINKLLREKGHWERRIVELGGPDYGKIAPSAGGAEDGGGAAVASSSSSSAASRGAYRYFGAAKLLPGVKELFEAPPARGGGGGGGTGTRKKRPELVSGSGGDYYGFRDEEENPEMLKEEAAADAARDARLMREWEEEHGSGGGGGGGDAAAAAAAAAATAATKRRRKRGSGGISDDDEDEDGEGLDAGVKLPDKEELEAAIVARKKAALLAKYA